jgi:hypothetical protein
MWTKFILCKLHSHENSILWIEMDDHQCPNIAMPPIENISRRKHSKIIIVSLKN